MKQERYRRLVDPNEHNISGDVYIEAPLDPKHTLSPEVQKVLDRMLQSGEAFKRNLYDPPESG